jgi:quercetin dioxygenase-like cupin family protein
VPHELTGGAVAFVEQSMAGRHLIRGHVHERTDVWIYVLDGEVGVRVDDDEATGTPGAYLLKPRGVPHAMWNPGDVPNRFIEILTPGDGDLFFREARELPDDTSREAFEAMSARHGIRWFDDWTDDLRSRYALT